MLRPSWYFRIVHPGDSMEVDGPPIDPARRAELAARIERMPLRIREVLKGHEDIYFAGFVHDAQKEYAEARLTLAFVTGSSVPAPGELLVDGPAYLNGLAEGASELRRYILDLLRRGEQVARHRCAHDPDADETDRFQEPSPEKMCLGPPPSTSSGCGPRWAGI